jgi:thiamine biosynthesis lipoprotein ApbE
MPGNEISYRAMGITAVAWVAVAPIAKAELPGEAAQTFQYHHAQILGTVMDLTVVASSRDDADAAERAVLAEIQRLQKILSAYDSDSELVRLNASPVGGPAMAVSPELVEVLKRYDLWFKRSQGAYSGHAGDLVARWTLAEKSDQLPNDSDLLAVAERDQSPAWEINKDGNAVRRISDQQLNVDSLGKGYIIDLAVAAATKAPNHLRGLLLNIGGDLRTWGNPAGPAGMPWSIGVQDPAHPELNAKPLTTIYIPANRSVSSSGSYQRFYTIGGKQYSHILDARTGKSGHNPAATVVAADSATANALSTICCGMKYTEAIALVQTIPGADCLIVTTDGLQLRTEGFKHLQDTSLGATNFATGVQSQFPSGYKLSIGLETVQTQRRPYVFVWVTDSSGRHVKTLAAFGNDPRYWRDMREWWKVAQNDRTLQSITHATQLAGKYPLTWDGTDQKGKAVPLGKYNIWVEVSAEHGPYSAKFAPIVLGKDPATAKITASSAFEDVTISYGPGEKK